MASRHGLLPNDGREGGFLVAGLLAGAAVGLFAGLAVGAAIAGEAGVGDPEVIHSDDGVKLFRYRGEDARQRGIEYCVKRGMTAFDLRPFGDDTEFRFCCWERNAGTCTLPGR